MPCSAAQHQASDPRRRPWVSANAGSGKTYVLAQRVIRLLLDGTDPSKILCLTYTKAAAANMANRVFERLAGWTTLDDEALEKEIRKTGVKRVDAKRAGAGAQAVRRGAGDAGRPEGADHPRLLHAAAAAVPVRGRRRRALPGAGRDAAEADDRRRSGSSVLLAAAANPDSAEGRALATIITLASDFAFQLALAEAIQERDTVTGWLDRAGGIDGAMAELSQALGIDAGRDDRERRARRCSTRR